MYEIKKLDRAELIKIKEANTFMSSDEIVVDNRKCAYFAVCDNNEPLAIFEVLDALDYSKHMRIFYNSRLSEAETGSDYEKNATITFNILIDIFYYLKTKVPVKIYSNENTALMVFSLMAKKLQEKDEYEVKLYRRWIEIGRKEIGLEMGG